MRFILSLLVLLLPLSLLSQTGQQPTLTSQQRAEARAKARINLRAMSAAEKKERNRQFKSRKPLKKNFNIQSQTSAAQNLTSIPLQPAVRFPVKFSVPGEFEESQAVLLSWSYFAYDVEGNPVDEVLTRDFGFQYTDHGSSYKIVPIAGYEIDTMENSDFPLASKWAELADAIHKEVPVWIVIYNDEDSVALKDYMARSGKTLVNYRFFNVGGGNAYWIRDFGPIGFYFGDQDSIGFIDPVYYTGRAADDSIPGLLANQLGYMNFPTQLKIEGGNFMCDGYGSGFTSSMVDSINLESDGQWYVKYDTVKKEYTFKYPNRGSWSAKKTLDTLKGIFGPAQMTVLQTLVNDGGTGHIDMYTKLFDGETILSSSYPVEFDNEDFPDYDITRTNIAAQRALDNAYGRPYRLFTMPVPTCDNGQYDSTTADTFGWDPRGFLNGLTINKTYIFPSFSSNGSGNENQLQEILALYTKLLPGYKLVPIDSRILTPMGGALHCITMQIPAENPVRFHHPSWRGDVNQLDSYAIKATITNKSGIADANLYWKKKGTSAWNSARLTKGDSNSFVGQIPGNLSAVDETIEYFLDARSNNGKTATLPIVAPEGTFTFHYGSTVNVADENVQDPVVSEPYPNPAGSMTIIPVRLSQPEHVQVSIYDVDGMLVLDKDLGLLNSGMSYPRIYFDSLQRGIYSVRIRLGGGQFVVKKIVVV